MRRKPALPVKIGFELVQMGKNGLHRVQWPAGIPTLDLGIVRCLGLGGVAEAPGHVEEGLFVETIETELTDCFR